MVDLVPMSALCVVRALYVNDCQLVGHWPAAFVLCGGYWVALQFRDRVAHWVSEIIVQAYLEVKKCLLSLTDLWSGNKVLTTGCYIILTLCGEKYQNVESFLYSVLSDSYAQ